MKSWKDLKTQTDSISEKELIGRCLRSERSAQHALYEKMGPVMLSVCRRYLYDKQMAEAVLNQAFLKVFQNLKAFRKEGSFEGWVRKIMVRESLNENQKKKAIEVSIDEQESTFLKQVSAIEEAHDVKQIMRVIEALPDRYRIVFNLYEIEGYSHKEIAKQLGINVSSSRSLLTRAKQLLREKLKDIEGL